MPNYALLLREPPPTTKGESTMENVLATLPNVSESVSFASMSIVLTGNYTDKVGFVTFQVYNNYQLLPQPNLCVFSLGQIFLGNYPDERFDEDVPRTIIEEFQKSLSEYSQEVAERNTQRNPPYIYMDPAQMENSIAI